jgi:hypothetical protein
VYLGIRNNADNVHCDGLENLEIDRRIILKGNFEKQLQDCALDLTESG